jgi:hypothetical protein
MCVKEQPGGAGGGRVRLTAASLTVATGASISADGRAGGGPGAGGGTGGSIELIITGAISGGGSVTAVVRC